MEFKTISDFQDFLDKNGQILLSLDEISSDESVFLYLSKTNQIAFFDYKKEEGWLNDYSEVRNNFEKKGIDLRFILSEYYGGQQYSRRNYIDSPDSLFLLLKNNSSKYNSLLLSLINGYNTKLNYESVSDSIFSNLVNENLNKLTKDQRIKYEIPLLFLFLDYASHKYSNKVEIEVTSNQFKERFNSIKIVSTNNSTINLTDLLFRVLYPDYFRDDFDSVEDVCVDINNIKDFIDYHNSDRFLKIQNSPAPPSIR